MGGVSMEPFCDPKNMSALTKEGTVPKTGQKKEKR